MAGDPPWVGTVRRRARLDGALTVFVAADGADQQTLDNALNNALRDLFADHDFTRAVLAAEQTH